MIFHFTQKYLALHFRRVQCGTECKSFQEQILMKEEILELKIEEN